MRRAAGRYDFVRRMGAIALSIAVGGTGLTATGRAYGAGLTWLSNVSAVDFGRQEVGAAGPVRAITIANGGTAPMTVAGVGVAGPNASDFSVVGAPAAGTTLPSGAAFSVTVSFAPTEGGARSGRLTIASDAGGSPYVIPLVGFGLDPNAPTRAAGPVDVSYDFPAWYQDESGLRLTLCLDPNGPCLTALPDPTRAPVIADSTVNFPDEAFWWSAEARIARPVGGKAQVTLAKEAAFANGVAAVGAQITFDRIRIRVDKLVAGRTYKVTHPYGVENLKADSKGEINVTVDTGCGGSPCNFDAALASAITVFLTWDPSVPPAAPAGYVGDPALPHKVVGSPRGTNFFRVEGPNAGGSGVNVIETDLFTVSGKLY